MKPRIGIAGSQRTMVEGETHWLSYTPRNFVTGLTRAGGLPFVLPVGEPEDAPSYMANVDKLLLAGGQDVDPRLYHALPEAQLKALDVPRDHFELALIAAALEQGKPIFAVCRGMQLLNVALGGSLVQDLSLREENTLKHDQFPTPFAQPTHPVMIKEDSLLSTLLPASYQVNSFHHQTIHRLGSGLTVTATAPDGVIEGIEDQTRRLLGVQWHPELSCETIATEQGLFDYFVHSL